MDAKIKTIAHTIVSQIKNVPDAKIPGVMQEIVEYLAKEKLIDQWREIEQAIHQVWKEVYGASKITVVSAHPITQETNEAIEKIAYGADITRRVDERLIGGSIIRIDDKRVDGSIAGQLQKLKTILSK
ncbi:F0F1 ATP synthase subunit delta [Patescibacteria group bacterium]|nr:F0F1 ATP synthase subunit delta [Patescibacteria group bacterium]MCG2687693.1 F0F1 ATP synthase subunit delta [Candidatus Parcubacteria bacterium]